MSLSIAIITTFAITAMHASDKTERSNHANNSCPENISTLDGQVWATCNSWKSKSCLKIWQKYTFVLPKEDKEQVKDTP